jgi:hypothetical protein
LQVETILPIDLTDYAIKRFNTTLEQITHVTYYLRESLPQVSDPSDKKELKNFLTAVKETFFPRILDLNRWHDKRITFVFRYFILRGRDYEEHNGVFPWMNKEEFNSRWEIRDDIVSAIHLTTTDLHLNQSHPHNSYVLCWIFIWLILF